jgi:glucosamine-6-phosphate deaminase
MEIIIKSDYEEIGKEAATLIRAGIERKNNLVLGLPTGSTPLSLFKELIRLHNEEGLDFSNVVTFNLDEYVGLGPDHPRSFNRFMREHLFDHINIREENVNIPDGTAKDLEAHCEDYEKRIMAAGGIDIQVLGIGRDGHIAFNEPGSSLGSRTRIKTLTEETIQDNSRFFENKDDVPIFAVTMGIGTIMEARKIILLGNGTQKADIISRFIEGPITSEVTASILQMHPRLTVVLDAPAAHRLNRLKYYEWVYRCKKKLKPGENPTV